ncbi:hypothetical protein N4Q63_08340 [Leclercia adecarboxylata]|uniref:Uncharacterized protein n=1 Tax=Leclercia adecarboxylata TaxID=83655 RepID=A0A9X4BD86_9ENTR|nr:hypothetical protein [Leclercia adecarboxylata]MDC6621905.1 hypothetical protein [Leclercia adecarboxylata]MDC6632977.1 hypothetical protein [Leclercia adecarboxylata]MDC6638273.1 hypothetical protein [Leclercia adecarboxylata]MDC6649016.1 hypothetical protein [Leclercia adecarboxylata]MDC6654418.1 hypothetical protein [Leclercia adecarboxylata]
MKRMTVEQENVLLSTAKRCNDELKAALAKKPKPKFDAVSRPLLAKHFEKIKGLGVPFLLFVYTIGRINGQFKEH